MRAFLGYIQHTELITVPEKERAKPMMSCLTFYPLIPEETLRAATTLYGKGNIYLRLGDQIDKMLDGLLPLETKPVNTGNGTIDAAIQYTLLTIFQYVEELDNYQMVEAVRNRVDLKYALHLPLNCPSHNPETLCSFRKQLFNEPASQQILQHLLDRLKEFGLFDPIKDREVDALQLLITVCTLNRFSEVVGTMHRALETLAVTDPEWLRQIALPYWYDRYNRKRRLPITLFSDEKWNTRALQIAADIKYLLGEIDNSHDAGLASLREIQEIRHVWEEQFINISEGRSQDQVFKWRLTQCASCSMATDA